MTQGEIQVERQLYRSMVLFLLDLESPVLVSRLLELQVLSVQTSETAVSSMPPDASPPLLCSMPGIGK